MEAQTNGESCWTQKNMIRIKVHGSHKNWKTRKNGKTFSSQGKVREFWTDWKSQGILPKVLEKCGNFTKNTGKVKGILASFYFYFFSDFLIEVYLLNRLLYLVNSLNKTLKKYWKMETKYWTVGEICQSENVGTMRSEVYQKSAVFSQKPTSQVDTQIHRCH